VLRTLKRAFSSRADATEIAECRRCGETLGPDATECPACESDEIACYRL